MEDAYLRKIERDLRILEYSAAEYDEVSPHLKERYTPRMREFYRELNPDIQRIAKMNEFFLPHEASSRNMFLEEMLKLELRKVELRERINEVVDIDKATYMGIDELPVPEDEG